MTPDRGVRGVPWLATAIVGVAVAAMIALGLWQLLIRLPVKDAQIAQLAANPARPPIAFPAVPDDSLLFRRTRALCAKVASIERAGAGAAGFRLIATCVPAAGGTAAAAADRAAFKVQLGTTHDPRTQVAWAGGMVAGWISHAPDATPLIGTLLRHGAPPMLLVASRPAPGLAANTRPDVGLVPNNHLSYAVQWFLFAAVATIIYALALRRRLRSPASGGA